MAEISVRRRPWSIRRYLRVCAWPPSSFSLPRRAFQPAADKQHRRQGREAEDAQPGGTHQKNRNQEIHRVRSDRPCLCRHRLAGPRGPGGDE